MLRRERPAATASAPPACLPSLPSLPRLPENRQATAHLLRALRPWGYQPPVPQSSAARLARGRLDRPAVARLCSDRPAPARAGRRGRCKLGQRPRWAAGCGRAMSWAN